MQKDKINEASFVDGDEDNNPFSNSHVHHGEDHDDEENILLFNTDSNGSKSKDKDHVINTTLNSVTINYESRVSKLLKPNSNVKIQITEASNSSEGSVNTSKKYIVYTIKVVNVDNSKEEIQTRRRYSDFESLREILTKIFPLLIIPPIPPKNYFNFSMLNNLVGSKGGNLNHISQPKKDGNSNTTTVNHGNINNIGNSTDYSYINSTHLHSNKLIEHRKRLLSNFLNNCLNITKIRNLEFFTKFLDPNTNWADEINLVTGQLPKDIYHSNPENGLKTDVIYSNLPTPISNHAISMSFLKPLHTNSKKLTKKTNKLFNGNAGHDTDDNNNNGTHEVNTTNEDHEIDSEPSPNGSSDNITDGCYKQPINTSSLDDINRKIMDNFIGLATDYTELGTVFNSFSLILADAPIIRASKIKEADDQGTKLNLILDKMGQVFDRSYITINSLINDLETKFSEPLGEEVQYTSILNFIQKFQKRKIKQKSLLDAEVNDKKQTLDELLKAEEESKKIEQAIKNEPISRDLPYKGNDGKNNNNPEPKKSKFKMFPNMNSIKKITQYVSDIIDQNPEQTRKQRISDLQVKIVTLEKCQAIMLEDISYIADELGKNVASFHNKQLKVIYEILLCYNGFLVSWAKKNIEIWEEIRLEIINL